METKALSLYRGEKIPEASEVLFELDMMAGEKELSHTEGEYPLSLSFRQKFLLCVWVGEIEEIEAMEKGISLDLLRQGFKVAVFTTRGYQVQNFLQQAIKDRQTPEERETEANLCRWLREIISSLGSKEAHKIIMEGLIEEKRFPFTTLGQGDNSKSAFISLTEHPSICQSLIQEAEKRYLVGGKTSDEELEPLEEDESCVSPITDEGNSSMETLFREKWREICAIEEAKPGPLSIPEDFQAPWLIRSTKLIKVSFRDPSKTERYNHETQPGTPESKMRWSLGVRPMGDDIVKVESIRFKRNPLPRPSNIRVLRIGDPHFLPETSEEERSKLLAEASKLCQSPEIISLPPEETRITPCQIEPPIFSLLKGEAVLDR